MAAFAGVLWLAMTIDGYVAQLNNQFGGQFPPIAGLHNILPNGRIWLSMHGLRSATAMDRHLVPTAIAIDRIATRCMVKGTIYRLTVLPVYCR